MMNPNIIESLHGRVVVIAGASSGIGLATALAFARQGAHVVLAARRREALQQAARDCEARGARALAVPTDVTDEAAVVALADAALAEFGTIDVWINNAGVGLFGPFAGAELASHRRVVETNLFGAMHGAAAALPTFLRNGHGVLITNISIGGLMPVPFAAAYTASKFALRGFMASLRQELTHVPGIHVCSVFPATIDTPGFRHGANVSGRILEPSGPIFPPEKVADAMVRLALRPRAEVAVGWPTRLGKIGYGVAPLVTDRATGAVFRRYVRRGLPAPSASGNLFSPVAEGTGVSGGWLPRIRPPSRARFATLALAGAGAAYLVAVVVHQSRSRPQTRRVIGS